MSAGDGGPKVKVTLELPVFYAGQLTGEMMDRGWTDAAQEVYDQVRAQVTPIPEIKNKYAIVEDDRGTIWVLLDDDSIPWKSLNKPAGFSLIDEWSAWEGGGTAGMRTVVKVHQFGWKP